MAPTGGWRRPAHSRSTAGRLSRGGLLTSSITRDAVEDLGLAEGSKVTALVKSTEVAIAVG